jgi:hypothetical protein
MRRPSPTGAVSPWQKECLFLAAGRCIGKWIWTPLIPCCFTDLCTLTFPLNYFLVTFSLSPFRSTPCSLRQKYVSLSTIRYLFLISNFRVFCVLYSFFWVIPRRLNFICRRVSFSFIGSESRKNNERDCWGFYTGLAQNCLIQSQGSLPGRVLVRIGDQTVEGKRPQVEVCN